MIIVPIHEEARSSRRAPWVTLAVVALCMGVFLHTRSADVVVDATTDEKIADAWAYFEAHPYVKVDPDTAYMLGEENVEALAQQFHRQLAASGSPPLPGFVLRHDQLAFDGIVEDLYAAMESHSFYRLGFFPSTLDAPDASLVTYVLAHEGWLHLVANLALVLLAGIFLEQVWGRSILAVFLVASAAAAATVYGMADPEAGALGGASGVAAALAGAFLVRFAGTPIRFRYFYIPPFGGTFTARGWITLPIYGATYFVVDHLLTYGGPGIEPPDTEFATWAHAGGLCFGLVFALLLRLLRIESRFVHPGIEKKLVARSNPALERALEAREAGRPEEALELLAAEVSRHPGNRDACLAYWDVASAVGRPREAADALVRVLRDEVGAGQKELATTHWRELTQRVPAATLDPNVEVRIATLLIETGAHDSAIFSIGRILDGSCGEVPARTLHRAARVAQDLDPGLARRVATKALVTPDLEPDERKDVEKLVAQLGGVAAAAAAPAPASEDPNEQTGGQLFGSGDDFDANPERAGAVQPEGDGVGAATARDDPGDGQTASETGDEPALSLATAGDSSSGRETDGDALNAAPFELDDLSVTGALPPLSPSGPEPDPPIAQATLRHGEVPLPDVDAPDEPSLLEALDDPLAAPAFDPSADGFDPDQLADAPATFDASDPLEAAPAGLDPSADALEPDALVDAPAAELEAPSVEPLPEAPPAGRPAAPAPSPPLVDLPAPEPADPPPPAASSEATGRRRLKIMQAIPLSLNAEALVLDVGERGKATLGLERIDAVAVAGVRGLKSKPVVVIDLLTNWLMDDGQPLKVVRLRSDRFDPRKLMPEAESGYAALKVWIGLLLERSGALALPDAASAAGSPFRRYEALEDYEREVLGTAGPSTR